MFFRDWEAGNQALIFAQQGGQESALVTEVSGNYPLHLGLTYLFLVGYLARTLLLSVGLPPSVGVIFSGFAFSYHFQHQLHDARDHLQELSFFLVLLTAGLEIRLRDLKAYIFVMAFLPATFEMLAIALYSIVCLNYTPVEGLVLGSVLFALGDGLVIPKMKEFGVRFGKHPLPRLMFTWAPLEASYALCFFGILTGFADPTTERSSAILQVTWNVSRVVATVAAAAFFGGATGWIIPKLSSLRIGGKQVFAGSPVEAFLIVLSVALMAYGIGSSDGEYIVVPMPDVSGLEGSLFQPELMVIMTGVFFAATASQKLLDDIEGIMGGVWIFGQLILFSMIGSRTTMDIFPKFDQVLPVLLVGMVFRFAGIWISIRLTLWLKLRGHPFQESIVLTDTIFCYLGVLPRATIQGALGQVPITERFFRHVYNKSVAQNFIFLSARLYICVLSVCGMILLNHFGPQLLSATHDRKSWEECMDCEDEPESMESAQATGESLAVEQLHMILAKIYSVSPEAIAGALQEFEQKGSTVPANVQQDVEDLAKMTRKATKDLALTQFDCLGSHLNNDSGGWHRQRSW